MDESVPLEQSRAMVTLLMALTRQLFAPDDRMVAELPLAQLRVCAVLYGGPRSMSALSRELSVSLSALTQIADRLERARLVIRVAGDNDRRSKCLQLTPRGIKIMRRREESRLQRGRAVLGHLSPQARSRVLGSLETLVQASTASRQSADAGGRVY
jgi:DNA-binding MarR family transcriptional regulator